MAVSVCVFVGFAGAFLQQDADVAGSLFDEVQRERARARARERERQGERDRQTHTQTHRRDPQLNLILQIQP